MGGPHVTLLPDEAGQHADVIFIGEAEGLWEAFLKEFRSRDLSSRLPADRAPSLENLPMARKDAVPPAATTPAEFCLPPADVLADAISAPLR